MLARIPYGRAFLECEVDSKRINGCLEPSWPCPDKSEVEYVLAALSRPTSSSPLRTLASKKKNIVILTSDNTRPVPSRIILPPVMREIRDAAPDCFTTLLIATGLHQWSPSKKELKEKYGSILESVDRVSIHSAKDENSLVSLGRLTTGNELYVNRIANEADLLISDGFIEGHFFAGFSGGPKSILPGVSGLETIMRNHSPKNIDDPRVRCGVCDGNPVYSEMCESAGRARLQFIVNVVLDAKKRIISAFAGDTLEAHRKGASFSLKCCEAIIVPSDIVITSNGGYPLDRDLYQLVKSISNAAMMIRGNGVIVACGECIDGVGYQGFYRMMSASSSPTEFLERLRSGQMWEESQWEAQVLAKILQRHHVIIVSKGVQRKEVEAMHMEHSKTLDEGLQRALEIRPNGRITLLPYGVASIPV